MEKILIASDGSAPAEKAAKTGIALAAKTGAHVTFVHVITIKAPHPLSSQHVDALKQKKAETVFETLEAKAQTQDVKYDTLVLAARNPADAILEEAKNYDLLVVGHRGVGGLEKMVLGSVSEKLVNRAPSSVLVVK
ncbi:universal stress protein [Candidatus Micrarchaeota archaeon]|nr:universal stress protein [Candidatus Micrarchaeota archaeon]